MNPADSDVAAAEKARRKDKKQKRKKHNVTTEDHSGATTIEESAPHEKKQKQRKDGGQVEEKTKMLKPTVSIAVAGSIIDNAQSLELATLLAGQIARAATVFRIDEVIIFDSTPTAENGGTADGEESGARFLVRILEYLETPQYLRRRLFPMHKNLKFVGLLPPLDAPHHVRKHEWSEFREGVTLEGDRSKGTLVDVGLSKNILVEQILEPGKRVTVAMGTNRDLTTENFQEKLWCFKGTIDLHKGSLGTEMFINVHGTHVTRVVGMNTAETWHEKEKPFHAPLCCQQIRKENP